MIKRITKYTNYILSLVLLIWVALGYNIIPLAIGAASIHLVLFVIRYASSKKIKIEGEEVAESPYRILISSRHKESPINAAAKGDIKESGALDVFEITDEDFEFEVEGYDEEEDTYDTDEESEASVGERTERNTGISDFDVQYRRKKIDSVLERVGKVPKMGGIEFEEFLRDLYDALGYVVHKTDINDQGADLIVMHGGEKIVIQAKRYKNKVNNSAIQQVFTAKAFYECDKAIVITNSEYTKSAREVAEKVGVELWDATSLQSMLSSMKSIT